MRNEKPGEYDDIIDLPHSVSAVHAPMPRKDRAAQFAPFAALTGYSETVAETARYTDRQMELDSDEIERLNRKLVALNGRLSEAPQVSITYFQPDARKAGGSYETWAGVLKRIDPTFGFVEGEDGLQIPISRIIAIGE